MSENMIQNVLLSYRKTAAFISAYELGIFQYIQDRSFCIEELSNVLHSDKILLELLLRYLKSIDLVEEEFGQWRIKSDFAENIKKYSNIIKHEKNLFNKWLSPDYITESVLNGLEGRQFNQTDGTFEEKIIYFMAMNSKNLDIIAFWIIRELTDRRKINYLEIGRSLGALSLSLKNSMPEINITIALNENNFCIYDTQIREKLKSYYPKVYEIDEFEFSENYDLVCMYNTIHYYPMVQAVELLKNLRSCMNEKSIICIADIFLKINDETNSPFLLDWITHGGVYNLSIEDLKSIMEKAGFKIKKQKYIAEISTDLIFGVIM